MERFAALGIDSVGIPTLQERHERRLTWIAALLPFGASARTMSPVLEAANALGVNAIAA
jgi:hypothetical protein